MSYDGNKKPLPKADDDSMSWGLIAAAVFMVIIYGIFKEIPWWSLIIAVVIAVGADS